MTPDLLYDQMIGVGRGPQARLLLRRQPRRRLAAPLPRRDRERLAARRSRSRSTATPAWRTATPPGAARLPFARAARLHRHRPGRAHARQADHLPVHRRGARRRAGAATRRRDRPRPGGRPRTATCSCGASRACRRRRCWRRGARWSPSSGSSTSSSRGPGGVVLPGWAIDAVAEAPRRLAARPTPRDHRARQRLLPGLGRDQPRPRRRSAPGWTSTSRRSDRVSAADRTDEVQTVVAARRLRDARSCFIGVGRPSTAAILARDGPQPGPRARLRVGDDRRQAAPDPAVDRRRRAGRDRRRRRLGARDVQLLDRAGPDRGRVPRRRPGRPLRATSTRP